MITPSPVRVALVDLMLESRLKCTPRGSRRPTRGVVTLFVKPGGAGEALVAGVSMGLIVGTGDERPEKAGEGTF